MLVSILHRATGVAMATGGAILFTWWLYAAASGAETYAVFHRYIANPGGGGGLPLITALAAKAVAIAFTWVFFQHLATGVRHLVMDIGAGFELRSNRLFAKLTMVFSTVTTVLLWGWVLLH